MQDAVNKAMPGSPPAAAPGPQPDPGDIADAPPIPPERSDSMDQQASVLSADVPATSARLLSAAGESSSSTQTASSGAAPNPFMAFQTGASTSRAIGGLPSKLGFFRVIRLSFLLYLYDPSLKTELSCQKPNKLTNRSLFFPATIADDFYSGPSTSSSYGPRFRMLDFYVQHGDRTFHLKVPDNEDVKSLKTLIQGETGCPPCQQSISGFRGSR